VTAFEVGPMPDVASYAASGLGILIMTASMVGNRQNADAPYAVLRLADEKARHPVAVVHRDPRPSAPAARALLTMIAERRQRGAQGLRAVVGA
jgi:DNA-binding transcriptional LysR family regulator